MQMGFVRFVQNDLGRVEIKLIGSEAVNLRMSLCARWRWLLFWVSGKFVTQPCFHWILCIQFKTARTFGVVLRCGLAVGLFHMGDAEKWISCLCAFSCALSSFPDFSSVGETCCRLCFGNCNQWEQFECPDAKLLRTIISETGLLLLEPNVTADWLTMQTMMSQQFSKSLKWMENYRLPGAWFLEIFSINGALIAGGLFLFAVAQLCRQLWVVLYRSSQFLWGLFLISQASDRSLLKLVQTNPVVNVD